MKLRPLVNNDNMVVTAFDVGPSHLVRGTFASKKPGGAALHVTCIQFEGENETRIFLHLPLEICRDIRLEEILPHASGHISALAQNFPDDEVQSEFIKKRNISNMGYSLHDMGKAQEGTFEFFETDSGKINRAIGFDPQQARQAAEFHRIVYDKNRDGKDFFALRRNAQKAVLGKLNALENGKPFRN